MATKTLVLAVILAGVLSITDRVGAQCNLIPDDDLIAAGFGTAVGISGSVALIGSTNYAYFFRLDGEAWTHEQMVVPPEPFCPNSCQFGRTLAIDGDVALIGADGDDVSGTITGSAFIFRYNGKEWAFEQRLTPGGGKDNDRFGWSVDISGDYALVGAINAGKAYLFHFNGSEWATPDIDQGITSYSFGQSVAVDGDTRLVGESEWDVQADDSTGRVHVYMIGQGELESLVGQSSGEFFGHSVSVAGNLALVGAPMIGSGGPGRAYIYRFDGATFSQEATLIANDGEDGDKFGWFVAIEGDTAAIGAPSATNAGAVYVFRFDGSNWTQEEKFTPVEEGGFGDAVAVSGEFVGGGAPGEGANGAAFVFGGPAGDDCNGNGNLDSCDIGSGTSEDINENGVPDECDLARGDLNLDGTVGAADLLILLGYWGRCVYCDDCLADLDDDCTVGASDLLFLLSNWG